MLGFILVLLGLLAVRNALVRARSASLALTAAVVTWIGAGLTLPYYGAEDFGLHAIASTHTGNLLELIKAVRYQQLAITIFGVGLVMHGIGALLAAVAIWQSGILPCYSGIVFAADLALCLPQFYLPPTARIAHGVLIGMGRPARRCPCVHRAPSRHSGVSFSIACSGLAACSDASRAWCRA